jgi:hypothetical protein
MIEFEQKYSTPLAQKQYELEVLIKHYEIERAGHRSQVLYAVALGLGYVLVMGGFIGYNTFDGGYVVSGWLSILTFGFFIAGSVVRINAEISPPNLRNPERFIQS